jgi:hypothetical protein
VAGWHPVERPCAGTRAHNKLSGRVARSSKTKSVKEVGSFARFLDGRHYGQEFAQRSALIRYWVNAHSARKARDDRSHRRFVPVCCASWSGRDLRGGGAKARGTVLGGYRGVPPTEAARMNGNAVRTAAASARAVSLQPITSV